MELLEVENLYKEFYKDKIKFAAVDHIHFSIREGECLGLVGESGCGKSTTASLIAGLLKPDKGTFRFFGEELTKSSSRRIRKNIQMIFQNPMDSFDPRYHLLSSVQQGLRYVEKCDKRELERRAQEAISFVGLKESYYKKPIHQLSGGECQRAAIARAIIGQPKLLICDEATSALDVSVQAQIINLLKELQEKRNLTYLFISHDLSVVEHISDTIGVMYLGGLVETGTTADIFANPLHPYTEALFSAIPMPDPDLKRNRIILEGNIPSPANPPKGCKFHTRCRKCMEICKNQVPEVKDMGNGHKVRCHLYD